MVGVWLALGLLQPAIKSDWVWLGLIGFVVSYNLQGKVIGYAWVWLALVHYNLQSDQVWLGLISFGLLQPAIKVIGFDQLWSAATCKE